MELELNSNETSYQPLAELGGKDVWYNQRQYIFAFVAIAAYFLNSIWNYSKSIKAPAVGVHSIFEPGLVRGFRYGFKAGPILREGYDKFKNGFFKVQRNDTEILVVSHSYVNELRELPEKKMSAMQAHMKNMVGKYTIGNLHMMLTSDLQRRTIQRKLTPSLGNLIPPLKDELNYSLKVDVPEAKDWTSVLTTKMTVAIVARISARIFVGPDVCRNPEWLYLSIHFTENLGITWHLLRLFPTFTRPVVARLLPTYWAIYRNLAAGQRLLKPVMAQRKASALNDPDWEKPNDYLQWILDGARPEEAHPNDIAHRQLLISLGAIHTTSLTVTHLLFDFCEYPQHLDVLREEIVQVLREDDGFKKTTLNKLRKLDSFLRESQRMNPLLFLTFQRIAQETVTLKDGTLLPAGTHIAMASDAITRDPANLPGGGNPDEFDPWRYYRLREVQGNENRYQFATTDENSLHFGHGKDACPGRFFASNEIKLILSHLLMMYDFKFLDGKRPSNMSYEEAQFPHPQSKVLMRRRVIPEKDIAAIILSP